MDIVKTAEELEDRVGISDDLIGCIEITECVISLVCTNPQYSSEKMLIVHVITL